MMVDPMDEIDDTDEQDFYDEEITEGEADGGPGCKIQVGFSDPSYPDHSFNSAGITTDGARSLAGGT